MTAPGEETARHLTDVIHAAGLDARAWPTAMAALSDAADGAGLALFAHDAAAEQALGTVLGGYVDEAVHDFERYCALNPFPALTRNAIVGDVTPSDRWLSHRDLKRTDFYDVFFRRYGDLGPGAGTILARDRQRVAILSGHCAFARVEHTMPRLLAVLHIAGPHVRRALEMNARLDAAKLGAGIERSPRAVVLLSGDGHILAISPRAEAVLGGPEAPQRRLGRGLTLGMAQADRWMAAVLRRYAQGQTGGDRDVMRLPGGGPVAAFLDPVPPCDDPEIGGPFPAGARIEQAVGVLSFAGPPSDRQRAAHALGALWGLTPAEQRVALAVADGKSPAEIAAAFATSPHTVRAQLRAIYQRTGLSRQTAVAALVRALS